MKRIFVSGAVAMFFVVTALAGTAAAHTFVAGTSLSIHKAPTGVTKPGATVSIYGKLQSPRRTCRANRVVKLFQVAAGPDIRLAKDRTDSEGTYGFSRQPTKDIKVYTRFSGSLESSYGHSHECLRSRSSKLLIEVDS